MDILFVMLSEVDYDLITSFVFLYLFRWHTMSSPFWVIGFITGLSDR